ncbi:MAG TPA: TadE/TadG family type IV pilus assembly protein [Verrucomicrobiae bacterium]|nr:TadE/TadG family type IV pilus assembly protein [Verrucomicrobiae bacterium]
MGPLRNPARERGSVLVESSFALLPLLALLFGVIDIGFAVFVRNTMQFAMRQGVRYAVTSQTMPGMGQDLSIKTVVNTYAMGLLDGLSPTHDGLSQIAITYYDPVSLAPLTGPGSNIGGNIVVVSCTGLSWAWMVPLLRSTAPMQFSVSSADIMEATPLAGPPAR